MTAYSEESLPSENNLSRRAYHLFKEDDFLGTYAYRARVNTFDVKDNPDGIINMGTAVNRLMENELQSRLQEKDALVYDKKFQHYYDLSGSLSLRLAVSGFLKRHLCPAREIDPENIVALNGTTSSLDALGHVLCDPGDVFISPTPVYPRIFTNFCERACVDVRPLELTQEPDSKGQSFSLHPLALEKKIKELLTQGAKVKGVILVHPHNPLGDVYSKSLLQELLQVCARYKLHVVFDEVYALSIFGREEEDDEAKKKEEEEDEGRKKEEEEEEKEEEEKDQFISSLAVTDIPDPQRTHCVWGLSKDFGLAGLRVSFIHSLNKDLINGLKRIAEFQCTPAIMHHVAETLLNDKEWSDNFYLPTNRRKLKEANEFARCYLEDLGLKVRKAKAGFFIWFNAQNFMSDQTKEAELALFDEIFNEGVYIVPGNTLRCANPGWFRLVASVHPEDLKHGLQRIKSVLERKKKSEI